MCEDPWTNDHTGVRVKLWKEKAWGHSLVHWKVTRSQSGETRSGICGRSYFHHTGAPGHLGQVLTSYLLGCWCSRKPWSLTITTESGGKLRSVKLRESEMIPCEDSILSQCIWPEPRLKLECDWVITVFARDVPSCYQNAWWIFQGINPTTIVLELGKILSNITATSLTEVVGCQERIIPAAEVVGQNSSEDICRRFFACSVASAMSNSFMTLWTVTCQAPLFMGFSRQDYCTRSSFSSPGNLPNPRIEPESLVSPALAGGFFTTSATLEALNVVHVEVI